LKNGPSKGIFLIERIKKSIRTLAKYVSSGVKEENTIILYMVVIEKHSTIISYILILF